MIDEKLIHSKVEDTLYVHDSFASMFRGMLNWFQDGFDQRFNYKVMATYDKAVQFFNQKRQNKDGNTSTNILPSITLDPNLDFINEERSGKFNWMFPNLNQVHGRYFTKRIDLKEQGVTVSIMRTRYSGTCDVTFWLQSIYELMDIRTKLIQYCNGTGRWIRPDFFWTHVIIPKDIIEFKRPTDGKQLDWSATPVEVLQLATTNTKEYGISYPLNAMWRLDSLSDGSTKYGADQLTEWKLTATFTWECDIPTFIRLDNYSFYDMHPTLSFGLGPTYSDQPLLNKIDSFVALTHDAILKKYLEHAQVYTVLEKVKPFIKLDESQCDRFPTFYPEYNHIVHGELHTYEELSEMELHDQLPEDFIFLMDHFKTEYIPLLRKANGCINQKDDSKSEFYTFVSSINLPTICNIQDKIYNALTKKTGKVYTIDPVYMTVYEGTPKVGRLDPDHLTDSENYDVCNRLLDFVNEHNLFQDDEYKRLDFGEAEMVFLDRKESLGSYDPKKFEYVFPYPITSPVKKTFKLFAITKDGDTEVPSSQYELYSHKIEFKDGVTFETGTPLYMTIEGYCKIYSIGNAINYHITKEDERAYYTKGALIQVDIPNGFATDYIKCCSYNGMLEEHKDFEVNEDNTKIVFKLEPQRDKVIQIFMNRK